MHTLSAAPMECPATRMQQVRALQSCMPCKARAATRSCSSKPKQRLCLPWLQLKVPPKPSRRAFVQAAPVQHEQQWEAGRDSQRPAQSPGRACSSVGSDRPYAVMPSAGWAASSARSTRAGEPDPRAGSAKRARPRCCDCAANRRCSHTIHNYPPRQTRPAPQRCMRRQHRAPSAQVLRLRHTR